MTAQTTSPPVERPYVMTSKGVEVRQPDGAEGSRWYVDPETGDLLASVTTAISACTSKPWLTLWAAKLAAEAAVDEHALLAEMLRPRDSDSEWSEAQRAELHRERRQGAIEYLKGAAARKREHASERGTWVHDVVEALVLDQPIPEMREDVKAYVDQFVDWWCDFSPVPFMSEATVADPIRGWAGTLDLGAYFPSLGHSAIIDVKTGANLDVFMRVQLNTYRQAKVVWLPLGRTAPMPKSDRAYVLHLMPDAYKLIDVTDDTGVCYGQFLSMLEQLSWRDRQGKRLGTVIYPPLPDGSQPAPLLEDIDGIPAVTKLIAAGVERLDQLFDCTAADLMSVSGFGVGALRQMPAVCTYYGKTIEGLDAALAELDAAELAAAERRVALAEKRAAAHEAGKHDSKPIKGCAACDAALAAVPAQAEASQ